MDAKPTDDSRKRGRPKDLQSPKASIPSVKQAKTNKDKDSGSSKASKDAKTAKDVKTVKETKTKPGKDGRVAKDNTKSKDGKPKEPKKRKAKVETKGRPKLPVKVDLNKHCGVPLMNSEGQLTGNVCVRSLSCKTHSMGSKRAVPGRSKPFDVLFAAYQQRNSMRHAMTVYNNEQKRQDKLDADASKENSLDSDADEPPLSDANEVAAVLRGALHSTPVPLDRKIVLSNRLRTNSLTLRELLYKSAVVTPPAHPIANGPPLATVMAATDAVLGRCVLFNPITRHQSIRPSQAHANAVISRALREKTKEK